MKLKQRMLACLLAVLMLIGCVPMFVFAESGSGSAVTSTVTAPTAPSSSNKTLEDIKSGLGDTAKDLMLFIDFNALELNAQVNGTVKPNAGLASAYLNVCATKGDKVPTTGFKAIDDGNGGKALQFVKGDATDYYFDILPCGPGDAEKVLKADHTGDSFVLSMDVKGGDDFNYGTQNLIYAFTRVASGKTDSNLVKVGYNGALYAAGDTSTIIGYLNSEVFTTIAVRVDIPQNRYFIYINGVLTNAEGYTYLSESSIAKLKDSNGDGKSTINDYILNGFRIYQVGKAETIKTTDITCDNILLYYSDRYLGTTQEKNDGFAEADGKVYYNLNGSRVARTTGIAGFDVRADKNGVITIPQRTSIVDFADQYKKWENSKWVAQTGDNIRDSINGGTKLIKDNYTLPGVTLYDWLQIQSDKSCASLIPVGYTPNTKYLDLSSYESIEINLFGANTKVVTLFALYNDFKSTAGTGNPYAMYYLNLSDKTFTGYKSGTTTSPKTIGNPLNASGWSTITFDISKLGFGRSDFDISKVYEIRFNTSGWDMDNKYDVNGNTLFNDGSGEVYFQSINAIKYTPATSLSEVVITVDGAQIPASSSGWFTSGANKFYYAPWTKQLVKNATIIDLEDGKGYTFDTQGRCIGLAQGICEIAGSKYYFADGVMAKSNVTIGTTTYEIGIDGKVHGVIGVDIAGYEAPAPYVATNYNETATYLFKGDFNSITPKVYNTIRGFESAPAYSAGASLATVFKANNVEYYDKGDGDIAFRWFNTEPVSDPYLNVNLTNEGKAATNGKKVVIEVDVMIGSDWDVSVGLIQVIQRDNKDLGWTGGSNFNTVVKINNDGYAVLSNGTVLAKLSSEEFTKISVAFDFSTRKYDAYVNGVKLVSGVPCGNANLKGMNEIRMMQYISNTGHGTIAIDNLYSYVGDAPQYVANVALKNGFVLEPHGLYRQYKNGLIASGGNENYVIENRTYKVDNYGVARALDGVIDGVLWTNGVKFEGYNAANDTFYVAGVPGAGNRTVTDSEGNKWMYIYGEDGKLLDKYSADYKSITLKMVVNGVEVASEKAVFTPGNAFSLTLAQRDGYTLEIVSENGNTASINSNTIYIESVGQSDTYTITYTTVAG